MNLLLAAVLTASAAEAESLADYARSAQGRHAYGLYVKGKKAGWAVDEIKVVVHAEKPALRSTNVMYFDTLFDGVRSVKEARTTVYYSLEGEGPIVSARQWKKDDGIEVTREAKADGKKMTIITIQGKDKSTREVAVPRDNLAGQRKLERWLRGKLKAGEKQSRYTVSWEAADIDEKETYTFHSRKSVALRGVKTELLVVESRTEGASIDAEVFPDGRMYKAVLGGFLEIRLEPEASARKMDEKLVDLLEATSVVLDRDLGPSGQEVDELTLELTGLGKLKVPESRRQSVKSGKESVTVTLKRDAKTDVAEPLTEEDRKQFTATSPRLCCDSEKVKAAVKEVLGDEKDASKVGRRLASWVNAELKKSYADNADNALDVLDRKAGSCVQHSLLFVALCRAAGVPAREAGGVAYIKAGKPRLGWHAWAEYHDGKQWVSVDPTWGQQRVDGTHLKLSEGERDMAWANVVGKLGVKVVAVKKRDD